MDFFSGLGTELGVVAIIAVLLQAYFSWADIKQMKKYICDLQQKVARLEGIQEAKRLKTAPTMQRPEEYR